MLPYSFLRRLSLAVASSSAICLALDAQVVQQQYSFGLTHPLDAVQEKRLSSLLKAWDPDARFSIDDERGEVQLCTAIPADRQSMEQHLAPDDLFLTFWRSYRAVPGTLITTIEILGFPKYQDTGNPVSDDLYYDEAKRLWIEMNPKVYANFLNEHH